MPRLVLTVIQELTIPLDLELRCTPSTFSPIPADRLRTDTAAASGSMLPSYGVYNSLHPAALPSYAAGE